MATLTVGTGGTYSTLAAAQTAASNGDVLEIQPGNYSGAGWADFTCSKVITITDVDEGSITDTSGSCITLQANGCKWLASQTEIISSSTGTAFNVTGIGCYVDGWVTNTNASGEALVIGSGATGGDYQIQAANTSGASGSFGIKISTTGNPGLFHDCVIDGYEYGIEYTGTAQTSHYIRRCKILGGTRGVSNPYKATLVNCVIDGATTGSYAGLDVKVWNCTFQDCTTAINATASTQYLEIQNNIFDGCTKALKGSAGAEAAPNTNCYFDCATKYDAYEADVNEITDDPGLDVDYIPAEGSGVLDVGLDLGYADDLYHTSGWRPQGSGYDLGAVEREASLPPQPPTPLTGRRHEVHRIWPGGTVGTVTIAAVDYPIVVARARETLHTWIARVVAAAETATGLDWSGWLSPELELCLGCGVPFTWAGSTAGNAWAGWADGAAPAAPDRGYLLTGTAEAAAERLCAIRMSWPILHAYRMVHVHPASDPVLTAAPYRAPAIDLDVEIFCGQDDLSPRWTLEEWCYYRGTDSEVAAYTDTDGWVILRPIDEASRADLPIAGWAGTIVFKRRHTQVAA
jgi:hypothetical protein